MQKNQSINNCFIYSEILTEQKVVHYADNYKLNKSTTKQHEVVIYWTQYSQTRQTATNLQTTRYLGQTTKPL
jgi:hypothetical protein